MSMGPFVLFTSGKRENQVAPVFPVTGANEGLILSGTDVQLGQLATGLVGAAEFSTARNIPVKQFQLNLYTTNLTGVGGGFAVRSSLAGAIGVPFSVQNVNVSGAVAASATLSNINSNPTFRITGGANYTVNGYLMGPDYRPSGGNGIANGFNVTTSIFNATGAGPYEFVAFNATPGVASNTSTDLKVRGFYYRIPVQPTGAGVLSEIAFENTQGNNFFNTDTFALGNPGRTAVGNPSGTFNTVGALFEVNGPISAGDPGGGFAEWELGQVIVGAVTADLTESVQVRINGVVVNLIKAV